MISTHPMLPKLKLLKLSGMLNTLELRAEQASQEQLSPLEFFALLLDDELERREQNRLAYRLGTSGCNPSKTLSQFDFSVAVGVNRSFITDLAVCSFIQRHENVLFCGPTGVGKTHLANALGIEALKRSFRVISKPTYRLLADLNASRANGSYNRLMASILRCDLLILDDFGLTHLEQQQQLDLMEMIEDRHGKASTIIASQLPVANWYDVIGEETIADAILDRIVHTSYRIELKGESLRKKR